MFYGKQVALWVSQPALDSMSGERVKIIDGLFGEFIQKKTVAGGRLWYTPDCKAYGSVSYELLDYLSMMLHADKGQLYELVSLEPWETGWTKQVFTNRRDPPDMMLDIRPVFTFGGVPITKGENK